MGMIHMTSQMICHNKMTNINIDKKHKIKSILVMIEGSFDI